jgi:hypothetical protein
MFEMLFDLKNDPKMIIIISVITMYYLVCCCCCCKKVKKEKRIKHYDESNMQTRRSTQNSNFIYEVNLIMESDESPSKKVKKIEELLRERNMRNNSFFK